MPKLSMSHTISSSSGARNDHAHQSTDASTAVPGVNTNASLIQVPYDYQNQPSTVPSPGLRHGRSNERDLPREPLLLAEGRGNGGNDAPRISQLRGERKSLRQQRNKHRPKEIASSQRNSDGHDSPLAETIDEDEYSGELSTSSQLLTRDLENDLDTSTDGHNSSATADIRSQKRNAVRVESHQAQKMTRSEGSTQLRDQQEDHISFLENKLTRNEDVRHQYFEEMKRQQFQLNAAKRIIEGYKLREIESQAKLDGLISRKEELLLRVGRLEGEIAQLEHIIRVTDAETAPASRIADMAAANERMFAALQKATKLEKSINRLTVRRSKRNQLLARLMSLTTSTEADEKDWMTDAATLAQSVCALEPGVFDAASSQSHEPVSALLETSLGTRSQSLPNLRLRDLNLASTTMDALKDIYLEKRAASLPDHQAHIQDTLTPTGQTDEILYHDISVAGDPLQQASGQTQPHKDSPLSVSFIQDPLVELSLPDPSDELAFWPSTSSDGTSEESVVEDLILPQRRGHARPTTAPIKLQSRQMDCLTPSGVCAVPGFPVSRGIFSAPASPLPNESRKSYSDAMTPTREEPIEDKSNGEYFVKLQQRFGAREGSLGDRELELQEREIVNEWCENMAADNRRELKEQAKKLAELAWLERNRTLCQSSLPGADSRRYAMSWPSRPRSMSAHLPAANFPNISPELSRRSETLDSQRSDRSTASTMLESGNDSPPMTAFSGSISSGRSLRPASIFSGRSSASTATTAGIESSQNTSAIDETEGKTIDRHPETGTDANDKRSESRASGWSDSGDASESSSIARRALSHSSTESMRNFFDSSNNRLPRPSAEDIHDAGLKSQQRLESESNADEPLSVDEAQVQEAPKKAVALPTTRGSRGCGRLHCQPLLTTITEIDPNAGALSSEPWQLTEGSPTPTQASYLIEQQSMRNIAPTRTVEPTSTTLTGESHTEPIHRTYRPDTTSERIVQPDTPATSPSNFEVILGLIDELIENGSTRAESSTEPFEPDSELNVKAQPDLSDAHMVDDQEKTSHELSSTEQGSSPPAESANSTGEEDSQVITPSMVDERVGVHTRQQSAPGQSTVQLPIVEDDSSDTHSDTLMPIPFRRAQRIIPGPSAAVSSTANALGSGAKAISSDHTVDSERSATLSSSVEGNSTNKDSPSLRTIPPCFRRRRRAFRGPSIAAPSPGSTSRPAGAVIPVQAVPVFDKGVCAIIGGVTLNMTTDGGRQLVIKPKRRGRPESRRTLTLSPSNLAGGLRWHFPAFTATQDTWKMDFTPSILVEPSVEPSTVKSLLVESHSVDDGHIVKQVEEDTGGLRTDEAVQASRDTNAVTTSAKLDQEEAQLHEQDHSLFLFNRDRFLHSATENKSGDQKEVDDNMAPQADPEPITTDRDAGRPAAPPSKDNAGQVGGPASWVGWQWLHVIYWTMLSVLLVSAWDRAQTWYDANDNVYRNADIRMHYGERWAHPGLEKMAFRLIAAMDLTHEVYGTSL